MTTRKLTPQVLPYLPQTIESIKEGPIKELMKDLAYDLQLADQEIHRLNQEIADWKGKYAALHIHAGSLQQSLNQMDEETNKLRKVVEAAREVAKYYDGWQLTEEVNDLQQALKELE